MGVVVPDGRNGHHIFSNEVLLRLGICEVLEERRGPPQPYIDQAQEMTVSQPIGARSPDRESITPPGSPEMLMPTAKV